MKHTPRYRQALYTAASFFTGALLLCIFSTFQKKVIGAPLVIKGYLVPFFFGGLTGSIIGLYIALIKRYNRVLKERINSLESLLPICASCKKIRKPDSNAKIMDSWVPVESYISERTTSRFSHGICPECTEKLYGDI